MPTPTTRSAAIKAKCRDCIYDPYAAGTALEQVAACTSGQCPLFNYRPLPKQIREKRESVAQLRARLAASSGRSA